MSGPLRAPQNSNPPSHSSFTERLFPAGAASVFSEGASLVRRLDPSSLLRQAEARLTGITGSSRALRAGIESWRREISLFGTHAHHFIRDQLFQGARMLGEELHSWGAVGDGLIQAGVIVALSRNPRLSVEYFHVIGELPEPLRQNFWDRALKNLSRRGVEFPRDEMRTYDQFIETMRRNGINFDRRIHSLETAVHLLDARRHPSELGRERPIAVIVANIDDHNGAFVQSLVIDDLVRSGRFDVVYFEAASDAEALSELNNLFEVTGGRRIHTLVLAGHGTRDTLQLGKDHGLTPGTSEMDSPLIDVNDRLEGELFSRLPTLLREDGQVLVWACSTGAPLPSEEIRDNRRRGPNLADRIALALPGRQVVHATETPNNILGLSVDDDGSLILTWQENTPHVVRSTPSGTIETVEDTADVGVIPSEVAEVPNFPSLFPSGPFSA